MGARYRGGVRWRENRAIEAVSTLLATGQELDAQHLASVVGEAIRAEACALQVADRWHRWGTTESPWLHQPVAGAGEPQGILAVAPGSLGPLPTLAAALGPPLAALRLTAEIERLRRRGDAAARQLVDDRWRAAAEMEQERRGLERDLHDGAQHHLVALRMSLALVEHAGTATADRLTDLLNRLDNAERVLLDTAAGVLPVALATDGLAAALRTEFGEQDDIELDIAGLRRRYPPAVESAVYFACLEAVNNAHKHAPGAAVTVTVRDTFGGLEFTVTDTGPGFAGTQPRSGLQNMSQRAAAVGGTVEVRSTPGHGTTVAGVVPF